MFSIREEAVLYAVWDVIKFVFMSIYENRNIERAWDQNIFKKLKSEHRASDSQALF